MEGSRARLSPPGPVGPLAALESRGYGQSRLCVGWMWMRSHARSVVRVVPGRFLPPRKDPGMLKGEETVQDGDTDLTATGCPREQHVLSKGHQVRVGPSCCPLRHPVRPCLASPRWVLGRGAAACPLLGLNSTIE